MLTDIRRALYGAAVAEALADDPFYVTVCVAGGVKQLLPRYVELALIEGEQAGRVDLADEEGSGAAIWSVPGDAARKADAYAARERELAVLLGEQGYANFQAIVANMEANLAPHGLSSAWYLSIAGIRPDAQSGGLGSRLLSHGLAAADRAGAVSFLETFNGRSLPFYRGQGYEVAAKYHEPVTGADY
ncbi:N-acetyltransferase [Massilia sp. Root418]|jgi:GNAT superfamily N-acetyltransferase|uniref:GNAT family N-acetyltransferase n=1 Tax=Massilia sp. Root418 TaxID=1736532 RepID=UPI000B32161C|nr:GNAT family N-acetyltransferase [Massilia sp. Root418]